MVAGHAVCESLIVCEVTIASCLCHLCDPISTQIPFLLCLQHVLCASFIPVHHPLRIWQTDLQLLSQAVQGVNWSKNVLCYTPTHIYTHTTMPVKSFKIISNSWHWTAWLGKFPHPLPLKHKKYWFQSLQKEKKKDGNILHMITRARQKGIGLKKKNFFS